MFDRFAIYLTLDHLTTELFADMIPSMTLFISVATYLMSGLLTYKFLLLYADIWGYKLPFADKMHGGYTYYFCDVSSLLTRNSCCNSSFASVLLSEKISLLYVEK